MNNLERYLRASRKYFDYSKDDDIDSLCDYLRSSNVNIIVINSHIARNEVVKNNGYHHIIWDTAYWSAYEKFAQVVLTIMFNDFDENHYLKELEYLDSILLQHLTYKYEYINPDYALIMAKESIVCGFNDIDFARCKTAALEQVIKLAKINLLSHEVAHIEFERHKDLEERITTTIKHYLKYFANIKDAFEVYADYPEMKDILEKFPEFVDGHDPHLLMELADDAYSFVEGLLFVSHNLSDNRFIPMYIHGASIARWFNHVLNTADGVIDYLLSNKSGKTASPSYEHQIIKKTNYTSFFRYILFEPVMQITFTQVYKEAGFSYEEFEGIAKGIQDVRNRYNKRIAPGLDYFLRYKLHHLLSNNDILGKTSQLKDKRKIIDFLFSSPIK